MEEREHTPCRSIIGGPNAPIPQLRLLERRETQAGSAEYSDSECASAM